MPLVANPVPPARPALVSAAVRRASKQPSQRVKAKKTRKKWTLGDLYVPGVDGVKFEPFTEDMQGQEPGSYASDASTRTIYRAEGQPADPFILAHEMGHMMKPYMKDEDQQNFMRVMGFAPGTVWDQGTGREGLESPSEWFADYYGAVANRIDPRFEGPGAYAKNINRKRLRRFAEALARFGRYNQLSAYKEPTWR